MRQGERMRVNMVVLNAKGQHSLVNTPKADTPSVHGANISDQVWLNPKQTGVTTQTRCSGWARTSSMSWGHAGPLEVGGTPKDLLWLCGGVYLLVQCGLLEQQQIPAGRGRGAGQDQQRSPTRSWAINAGGQKAPGQTHIHAGPWACCRQTLKTTICRNHVHVTLFILFILLGKSHFWYFWFEYNWILI